MTNTKSYPTSVGIDVSKKTLAVALKTSQREYLDTSFENTQGGITDLISYLKTQKTAYTVPCVIESTGDFHLLSSCMLKEEGYEVKCINPIITHQYQRATIRNAKDDRIDAQLLANIGTNEPKLLNFTASKEDLEIKKVVTLISTLEKTKQKLRSSLNNLKTTCQTLGIKVPIDDAEEADKKLKKQIKILKDIIIKQTTKEARFLSEKVDGLSLDHSALIHTFIKGRTFKNKDQLVAFTGLDIKARRSGTWRGKETLSKRGNPFLRKILYHTAWGLMRYNEKYKTYYVALRARGLHYTTCLMAVARKFVRLLYTYYFVNPQVLG